MVARCAEIMDGNVMFLNNNLLCYENTINWKDILTGENSEVMHHRSSRDMTRECKHHDCAVVIVYCGSLWQSMSQVCRVNVHLRHMVIGHFRDESFQPHLVRLVIEPSQYIASARAWNSLPPSVRNASSLMSFRRNLKTVLFRPSFSA